MFSYAKSLHVQAEVFACGEELDVIGAL